MDFTIAAPGGVPAGNAAALAARGQDPAISIPAGGHLFRRINGLTLAPIPGALVPTPTSLPLSIVEAVCGDIFSTGGLAAVEDSPAFLTKILPTKLEVGLSQLELEPTGVGLDPNAQYESIGHAAAAVRLAIRRVRHQSQGNPLHPASTHDRCRQSSARPGHGAL